MSCFVGTSVALYSPSLRRIAQLPSSIFHAWECSIESMTRRASGSNCVYANRRTNLATMAKHAHDADIPFPAMLDVDLKLARLLKIRVTP